MKTNKKLVSPVFTPRRMAAVLLLVLIMAAEVFFDTWCAVQCRRTGYEIVQAESRQKKLLETRKKLTIEQSRLKSPQVLGVRARDEHGLITPKPDQIVIVP
ncbi:MAG: hypothetical protein K9J85_03020 [Desulfobacteraceae bacterium]|nr:hypothetical protein [Desulfobacteraceae bacterium]